MLKQRASSDPHGLKKVLWTPNHRLHRKEDNRVNVFSCMHKTNCLQKSFIEKMDFPIQQ
jgi:hypothetical protein